MHLWKCPWNLKKLRRCSLVQTSDAELTGWGLFVCWAALFTDCWADGVISCSKENKRPWTNNTFRGWSQELMNTEVKRRESALQVSPLNSSSSSSGSVSSAGFSTQGDLQTTRPASACARMKSSLWRASVSAHTHTHAHAHTHTHTHSEQLVGWDTSSHLGRLTQFHFSHHKHPRPSLLIWALSLVVVVVRPRPQWCHLKCLTTQTWWRTLRTNSNNIWNIYTQ